MTRPLQHSGGIGALAAMALLVLPASAAAGPPWISVEYPANRLDPATRGAIAVVHTYHHETAAAFPLEGTAEGIVEGKRVSRPLEFGRTARDGAWAVRGEIPDEGTWVLVVTATDGEGGARASALIALGPRNDEVSLVKIPRSREGNWPRPARDADVREMLQLAQAVNGALEATKTRLRAVTIARGLGGTILFALPFGIVGWSRRKRQDALASRRSSLSKSSDLVAATTLAPVFEVPPAREVPDGQNAVHLHRLLRAGARGDQPRSRTVDGHVRRVDPAAIRNRGAPLGG